MSDSFVLIFKTVNGILEWAIDIENILTFMVSVYDHV